MTKLMCVHPGNTLPAHLTGMFDSTSVTTFTHEAQYHYHHGGCEHSGVQKWLKEDRRMILTVCHETFILDFTPQRTRGSPSFRNCEERLYYQYFLSTIPKQVLGRRATPRGVVVDVGANIGWLFMHLPWGTQSLRMSPNIFLSSSWLIAFKH